MRREVTYRPLSEALKKTELDLDSHLNLDFELPTGILTLLDLDADFTKVRPSVS
jgi:hypothetical protein